MEKARKLSPKTLRQLERVVQAVQDEGFNVWGFIFRDMGEEAPALDIFTNQPDPIPVFIVKTKAALDVLSNTLPEEFNLDAQEKAVAEYVGGKISGEALTQLNPKSKPN